jgi:glycosyltransferase involved in cell wall biosynthesis
MIFMSTILSQNQIYSGEKKRLKKLIVIPAYCHSLGGTNVSLLLLAMGFQRCGASEQLRVLVHKDSFLEGYFRDANLESFMELIEAGDSTQFFKSALSWVMKQPTDWSLLLDNCVWRSFLPILTLFSPLLRLGRRPVYHFCHDLALSRNYIGYLARKFTFACVAPGAICNSQFTAGHIRRLMPDIRGILYQPVDLERFNLLHNDSVPLGLEPILRSGTRVMLTPSRLNKPGIINDKNLRSLIPVLAHLKLMGHNYHGVVIGPDASSDGSYTRDLLESAAAAGIADRFTVLPPAIDIAPYYKYADVVVTLSPREPFGRTVVEAIACGVPVVGSCTGGINEILQHFAPQWTVDPNKPADIAQTIINVASDQNTKDLLTKGQAWVETNCGVAIYAKKMMQLTEII